MNPLLPFYQESHPDARGRYFADILRRDDEWLEYTHDYIQWLFPLFERSGSNPSAPLLDVSVVSAFMTDERLQTNLRAAFHRMLAFYGLQQVGEQIHKAPNWNERKENWFTLTTHNDLRITRILTSLSILGLRREALQFFQCLRSIQETEADCGFAESAFEYWRAAIQRNDI